MKKQDEYKIVFEKAKKRLKRKLNLDKIHPNCSNLTFSADPCISWNYLNRTYEVLVVNLKIYLHFWNLFQTIANNCFLNPQDKFQYLFQSITTGSWAYDLVKNFPLIADNYQKAFEALKTSFGRLGLISSSVFLNLYY